MSKQLALNKIAHIEKELSQLKQLLEALNKEDIVTTIFEPQGLSEFYAVAYDFYGVTKEQILGKSRKTKIVIIRQIVCYFLKEVRGYGLNEIASLTGYKEHSAVLHSCRKVKEYLDVEDAKFITYYDNFKHLLK